MSTKTKIALVTGGSRGLGKNSALSIAAKGFDVILTYNSQKEEALAVVAEIGKLGRKAAALQLDAADSSSFDGFYGKVKEVLSKTFETEHFDFLVNNAGVGLHAPFAETTEQQFDNIMNIHFKGVFFLTQ